MQTVALRSRRIEAADHFAGVELFFARGWTDGLPIVPPTEERVDAMLQTLDRDPGEVVGILAPRRGRATLEKIAINAVMAGCRPAYFPVVVAAIAAIADDAFNLHGVQCTTHVAAPLVIINGPARLALEVNAGANCFGQGFRANATIGRAVRLCMINIGGGVPGLTDKATFGHPGKYTYCVAENEEASPWEPLHVERGFRPEQSTVTVFAAGAPHNVSDDTSQDAHGVLTTIADTMAIMGNNNMHKRGEMAVVIGLEHAATVAAEGWSRQDVKAFLFQQARRSPRDLINSPSALIPVVNGPEDLLLFVVGGSAGRFSLVIPGWGNHGTRAVTTVIPAQGSDDCSDGMCKA